MPAPAPQDLSLFERVGDVSFPLNADSIVSSDLVLPDLLRDTLLGLFAAAINYELAGSVVAGVCMPGTAWYAVRNGTELSEAAAIEDSFPGLPTEQLMLERKAKFPALFLDRVGEATLDEHSLSLERRIQQWEMTWVMGPMTAGNAQKFSAASKAIVPSLVQLVVRRRGHPAYQSGETLLGGGNADAWSLRMLSSTSDAVRFGENSALFYGCTIKLETIELDAAVDGAFTDLTGATLHIDGGGGDGGGLVADLIIVDSDHPG